MIWVVGEQQGKGGTRRRLAELLDVTEAAMMSQVLWLNLWEYRGTQPQRYVALVEEAAAPGDAILLLGRRVQHEFSLYGQPALGTIVRSGGLGPILLCLPHPSGRNRWWNDETHVREASAALRQLWGSHR